MNYSTGPIESPEAFIGHIKAIAKTSPTDAIDKALELDVWTPGSTWHREEILVCCANLAAAVSEWKLAGLAAYQAQRLHLSSRGRENEWGLPDLPGLEVAARRFNLVRYVPIRSKHVTLRRPDQGDREFLMDMFGDAEFTRQYSRPAADNVEDRVHQLIRSDRGCPDERDPWAWIICDINEKRLGILEFSTPNFIQRSVDIAMGLRVSRAGIQAGEAFAMGLFIAFHHLNMERITGNVYADNPRSHRLNQRMGMVRENTIDGLVRDAQTGDLVPLTTYSMLRDGAQRFPELEWMRRFFNSALPDLLTNTVADIASEIIAAGPRWAIFPPPEISRVPDPPVRHTDAQVDLVEPASIIEGRYVRLRQPRQEDFDTFTALLKTPRFVKFFHRSHGFSEDIAAISRRVGVGPGMILLWLVEETRNNIPVGFVGAEVVNEIPVLFGVAGFDNRVAPRGIAEIWRLFRKMLAESYPQARLYLMVPGNSDCLPILERRREFQRCGVQRHQKCIGYDGRIDLEVLLYVGKFGGVS